MKNGDVKYKEMFVKKMKQLAKGERSHKLQKPLKGCESIICEYRCLDTMHNDCVQSNLLVCILTIFSLFKMNPIWRTKEEASESSGQRKVTASSFGSLPSTK